MKMQPVTYQDFSGGVISNLPATKLARTVSPRAWNSALIASKGGGMLVTKRPGWKKLYELPAWGDVGAPDPEPPRIKIVAQGFYNYTEDNVTRMYHIAVADNGTIWQMRPLTAPIVEPPLPYRILIPVGAYAFPDAFLAGVENGVIFVQGLQSQILIGIVRNGECFKIYCKPGDDKLYVGTLGLPVPETKSVEFTVPGVMTGTRLEVRTTWLNANTGTESSASPTYATIGIPVGPYWARIWFHTDNLYDIGPPPPEITHINIYLRLPHLRTDFFRDATLQIPRSAVVGSNWYNSHIDVNYTDDQINGMAIKAPGLHEHDKPPANLLCGCWHLQRLFVSDGIRVFYSQPGNPEQFDGTAVELIGPGGQLLLGLMPLNDQSLGVFKEGSIHELAGADPQVWDQNELVSSIGCISTLSLTRGDGLIAFWSADGPHVWDQSAKPQDIGNETLKPLADQGLITFSARDTIKAVFDQTEHRFLFRLDGPRAWTVAPWSTNYGVWEALAWDMREIEALVSGPSLTEKENRVFFALDMVVYEMSPNYKTDGAQEDELGLLWARIETFIPPNIITLDRAGPFTVNTDHSMLRIVNATTLEVHRSTHIRDTLPGEITLLSTPPFIPVKGSPVIFDAAVMEWDTIDETNDNPSYEKRALQTYLEMRTSGDTPFSLGLVRDNELNPVRYWEAIIAANDKAALPWAPIMGGTVKTFKRWAGLRYQWMRSRFVGWWPCCKWGLTLVGWQAVVQDDEK